MSYALFTNISLTLVFLCNKIVRKKYEYSLTPIYNNGNILIYKQKVEARFSTVAPMRFAEICDLG